ncbi:hypothetical protein [Streptomyces sp. SID4982]|uniref:hypothetical protein n=1 Tax=Streptomyces sp. SID4982 TaxID=2690291 RepID=UPI00136C4607|nr:hypothetical protein [Streptomyces sp. SID4982]MYS15469.1 hypothetical protein [Streptomyces sp. SID4982]
MNRHLRKAVVVSAAITAGLLMTACQSGTGTETSGRSTTPSVAEHASAAGESAGTAPATEPGTAQRNTGTGTGKQPATPAPSPTRDTALEGIDKGEGVDGTWFGNVSYLAPGKYTVSDMKGVEQQFLLAEDTEIRGYDDICGDPGAADGTRCTEADLEAAAKKGFSAEVVISNGIATSIRDDH